MLYFILLLCQMSDNCTSPGKRHPNLLCKASLVVCYSIFVRDEEVKQQRRKCYHCVDVINNKYHNPLSGF